MVLLRLDLLTAYFSDAVVGGFSTGAACHVLVTQLRHFLGLGPQPTRAGPGALLLRLRDIGLALPAQTSRATLGLACCCVLFLAAGKFWLNPALKRRGLRVPLPFELVTVGGAWGAVRS